MMKKYLTLLILSAACFLSAAEPPPFLTIPWKPMPDQTELFAGSGKMFDVSCNEYALTFYVRAKTAGEEVFMLIAPGSEKAQGYVVVRCKAPPKRNLRTEFRVVPDLFAEHIEAEMRLDSTGQYVYRITVPWENLSTILPEKDLRLVLGGTFLPLLMPPEYGAAKKKIEGAICAAFQQETHLRLQVTPEMPFRKVLEQHLNMIKKDPAVRVRYLRAVLTEVNP